MHAIETGETVFVIFSNNVESAAVFSDLRDTLSLVQLIWFDHGRWEILRWLYSGLGIRVISGLQGVVKKLPASLRTIFTTDIVRQLGVGIFAAERTNTLSSEGQESLFFSFASRYRW